MYVFQALEDVKVHLHYGSPQLRMFKATRGENMLSCPLHIRGMTDVTGHELGVEIEASGKNA